MIIRRNIQRSDFKNMIQQNTDEIKSKLTNNNDILNQIQYKMLEIQYIKELWVKLRKIELIISINSTEFSKLRKCEFEVFEERIVNQLNNNNNKILINSELDIVDAESYKLDLNFLAQEISQNKIVFYFDENGVSVYYNGRNIKTSIFYVDKDFIDYSNRKPISELNEVLKNYRLNHLQQNRLIFFENNEMLMKHGLTPNTLKAMPEDYMKEDLKKYLNKSLQYTFTKNIPINDSGHNIDIYTVAEDKLYFITIEWLGQSISECKTKVGITHDESVIEKALTRALKSIDYLKSNHSNDIEKSYLALFDARDKKDQINTNQFYNQVSSKDKNILSYFTILNPFNLDNSSS